MIGANGEAHVTIDLRSEIGNTIGVGNRQKLKGLVMEHLESGYRIFVFDFFQVKHVDSSGLGVLFTALNRIKEKEGALELVNMSEELRSLFKEMSLDNFFLIRKESKS